MKICEFAEGLIQMLTNWIYSSQCFWYYDHHHQHYHHCNHHYGQVLSTVPSVQHQWGQDEMVVCCLFWFRTERCDHIEARQGQMEGRAGDGKFPSTAVPSCHWRTSIDVLRVIIHNRYSFITSIFLHYLDCVAWFFNICWIWNWILPSDWESKNIDKSFYILYHMLYSYIICINSNHPMSSSDDGYWPITVFLPFCRFSALTGYLTTLPWPSYHCHRHYHPWTECVHIHSQLVCCRQ